MLCQSSVSTCSSSSGSSSWPSESPSSLSVTGSPWCDRTFILEFTRFINTSFLRFIGVGGAGRGSAPIRRMHNTYAKYIHTLSVSTLLLIAIGLYRALVIPAFTYF